MRDRERQIRQQILDLVSEYYHCQASQKEFIPGETYINYGGRIYDSEEMVAIVDSCLDFWLTLGKKGHEFSRKFCDFLGRKYCVLVNSGSSANLIAFGALCSPSLENPIRHGDEVITVAACFPTTVNPIVQYGCTPVFVDIDLDTLNIDVTKLESALSDRTRAVMIAHMGGNPFDLDAVVSFVDKHDLYLIEDNCDALGSKYRGRLTGTFGHLATQSFYASHHITMGAGGAVVTDDPELHSIVLSLRDWGRDCLCDTGQDNKCGKRFSGQFGRLPFGFDHKYVYSHIGYNLQPLDLQPAIGIAQLDKLASFVEARRKNYSELSEAAGRIPWLKVQQATEGSEPSWFGLILTLSEDAPVERRQVIEYFEAKKIQTRLVFAGNIIHQPAYLEMNCRIAGELTNSDIIMERAFFIGVYPGIDRAKLEYMIKALDGLKKLSS